MARATGGWRVPEEARPRPEDHDYDLDAALGAVVALRARVPEDAYTAETLGTERGGSAVLIGNDGLLLTIGYLITEAEEVWLTAADGRAVPGHAVGFDGASGLGLVQALGRLDARPLRLGDTAARARVGERVVVAAGPGSRRSAVAARVVARQEFAGYWEYLLDEAIFTAPAHPHWGGAAVIGADGALVGVGSLQLGHDAGDGRVAALNMAVPADRIGPVMGDLLALGRPSGPARPWLGLYATEAEGGRGVAVAGLAGDGPARRAGLRAGDVVLAVAGRPVADLAGLFRAMWSLGEAGVDVPLTVEREGDVFDVAVASADRRRFLKAPLLH